MKIVGTRIWEECRPVAGLRKRAVDEFREGGKLEEGKSYLGPTAARPSRQVKESVSERGPSHASQRVVSRDREQLARHYSSASVQLDHATLFLEDL